MQRTKLNCTKKCHYERRITISSSYSNCKRKFERTISFRKKKFANKIFRALQSHIIIHSEYCLEYIVLRYQINLESKQKIICNLLAYQYVPFSLEYHDISTICYWICISESLIHSGFFTLRRISPGQFISKP